MTRSIYKARAKRIFFNIFIAVFIAALFGLALYYFTVGMLFVPIMMIAFLPIVPLVFEFIYFLAEQPEESIRQRVKGKIALAKEVFYFGPNPKGYIYLIRVLDEIYKIGLTRSINIRIATHTHEHGPIEIIALWNIPDLRKCEVYALQLTGNYHFNYNGLTREYRHMNEQQVSQFIKDFTNYLDGCYERTN